MLKLLRNRKGQGLVEYALIIAGVTLIAAVGITVFGHKVDDMISMVAAILPGATPMTMARSPAATLIETVNNNNVITLDPSAATGVLSHNGQDRLEGNVLGYGAYGGGDSGARYRKRTRVRSYELDLPDEEPFDGKLPAPAVRARERFLCGLISNGLG